MAAYYSFDSMGIITKQGIGSTSDVTAVRYRIPSWREKSAIPPNPPFLKGGKLHLPFL